jgi:stage III sporulation protein AH
MNSKRQTIWLVSMLSLMVVLSAYYLFTEDSGNPAQIAESEEGGQETSGIEADEAVSDGEQHDADDLLGWTEFGTGEENASDNSAEIAESENLTEEEVLEEVESQQVTSMDVFTEYGLKRYEEANLKAQQLYDIIGDSSQSAEAQRKAHEELRALEEREVKLTNLEEQLMQEYEQVVVADEGGKLRVVVQSPKLEKSQAVSIIDLVMKEMNVTQDKVSVTVVK